MSSREWRKANRDYIRATSKAWYEANKNHIREISKKRRETNPELERRRVATWVNANKDRVNATNKAWRKANPELPNKYHKAWREANPGAVKATRHARRARKRGAEGKYNQFDLHELLEKQGLSCYCGISFFIVDPTVDHVIPLARGGSNWPHNLQLLCQPCNDSKGAKTMMEWTNAINQKVKQQSLS